MPKSELKYLGVTMDRKGNYKKHAKDMAIKGKRAIGAARSLLTKKDLSHKNKCLIYKMLIKPAAMYACEIWASDKNSDPLEKMERWAFRYALNMIRDENKKYFRNEDVYEAMGLDEAKIVRMNEFIKEEKERFRIRLSSHRNPLIKRMLE